MARLYIAARKEQSAGMGKSPHKYVCRALASEVRQTVQGKNRTHLMRMMAQQPEQQEMQVTDNCRP